MSRLIIVSNRLPVSISKHKGEFVYTESVGGGRLFHPQANHADPPVLQGNIWAISTLEQNQNREVQPYSLHFKTNGLAFGICTRNRA